MCATNHAELLGRALFRRFDEVIQYALPDEGLAKLVLATRLKNFGYVDVPWPELRDLVKGLSQAELVSAADDAMRELVLTGGKSLSAPRLAKALAKRLSLQEAVGNLSTAHP